MWGKRGGEMGLGCVGEVGRNMKSGRSCVVYVWIVRDISIEKEGVILKERCFVDYVLLFWCHIS